MNACPVPLKRAGNLVAGVLLFLTAAGCNEHPDTPTVAGASAPSSSETSGSPALVLKSETFRPPSEKLTVPAPPIGPPRGATRLAGKTLIKRPAPLRPATAPVTPAATISKQQAYLGEWARQSPSWRDLSADDQDIHCRAVTMWFRSVMRR